jgi:hypothetical protein
LPAGELRGLAAGLFNINRGTYNGKAIFRRAADSGVFQHNPQKPVIRGRHREPAYSTPCCPSGTPLKGREGLESGPWLSVASSTAPAALFRGYQKSRKFLCPGPAMRRAARRVGRSARYDSIRKSCFHPGLGSTRRSSDGDSAAGVQADHRSGRRSQRPPRGNGRPARASAQETLTYVRCRTRLASGRKGDR